MVNRCPILFISPGNCRVYTPGGWGRNSGDHPKILPTTLSVSDMTQSWNGSFVLSCAASQPPAHPFFRAFCGYIGLPNFGQPPPLAPTAIPSKSPQLLSDYTLLSSPSPWLREPKCLWPPDTLGVSPGHRCPQSSLP